MLVDILIVNPHREAHFGVTINQSSHRPQGRFRMPKVTPSAKTCTCITPVKAAELKSTYIKQIRELHSLLEIGAISDEDFRHTHTV